MSDTKNYLYHTTGVNDIVRMDWVKPDIKDDQAEVESVLTGICRSDIDMYSGAVPSLPVGMFGHEGLGIVRKAGPHSGTKVGDIVATRSDAAFARYYNTRVGEFVKVPEVHPKYLIEPIACGYNIGRKIVDTLNAITNPDVSILVYGSGLLSYTTVAYVLDRLWTSKGRITVIGRSYREIWKNNLGIDLANYPAENDGYYKVVALLSDSTVNWVDGVERASSDSSYIIAGAVPPALSKITLFQASWKNQTWLFPSPRDKDFRERMVDSSFDIQNEDLNVDWAWTSAYSEDEIGKGFRDGLHRDGSYCRGYVDWRLGKA